MGLTRLWQLPSAGGAELLHVLGSPLLLLISCLIYCIHRTRESDMTCSTPPDVSDDHVKFVLRQCSFNDAKFEYVPLFFLALAALTQVPVVFWREALSHLQINLQDFTSARYVDEHTVHRIGAAITTHCTTRASTGCTWPLGEMTRHSGVLLVSLCLTRKLLTAVCAILQAVILIAFGGWFHSGVPSDFLDWPLHPRLPASDQCTIQVKGYADHQVPFTFDCYYNSYKICQTFVVALFVWSLVAVIFAFRSSFQFYMNAFSLDTRACFLMNQLDVAFDSGIDINISYREVEMMDIVLLKADGVFLVRLFSTHAPAGSAAELSVVLLRHYRKHKSSMLKAPTNSL